VLERGRKKGKSARIYIQGIGKMKTLGVRGAGWGRGGGAGG